MGTRIYLESLIGTWKASRRGNIWTAIWRIQNVSGRENTEVHFWKTETVKGGIIKPPVYLEEMIQLDGVLELHINQRR